MEANLLMICISSFVSVFAVLVFLAVAMRLLIAVFPEKKNGTHKHPPMSRKHPPTLVAKE